MECQVFNEEISIAEGATFVVSDNVGNICRPTATDFSAPIRDFSPRLCEPERGPVPTAFVGKHRSTTRRSSTRQTAR